MSGCSNWVYEVINRKRGLTLDRINKLHAVITKKEDAYRS